jgi:hypothetical protein
VMTKQLPLLVAEARLGLQGNLPVSTQHLAGARVQRWVTRRDGDASLAPGTQRRRSRSGTSHRWSSNRSTIAVRLLRSCWLESCDRVSGEPGAVHGVPCCESREVCPDRGDLIQFSRDSRGVYSPVSREG